MAPPRLVKVGVLVAEAEKECFRRVKFKYWVDFGSESIRYCLAAASIRLGDVVANLWTKAAYMFMRRPDLSLVLYRIQNKRECRYITRGQAWR